MTKEPETPSPEIPYCQAGDDPDDGTVRHHALVGTDSCPCGAWTWVAPQ